MLRVLEDKQVFEGLLSLEVDRRAWLRPRLRLLLRLRLRLLLRLRGMGRPLDESDKRG
jgi:hypothetical protein